MYTTQDPYYKCLGFLILLLFSQITYGQEPSRKEITLKSGWTFMPGYAKRKTDTRPVTLPHTWNASDADAGEKAYRRGEGSYERKLNIPNNYLGKRLFLKFEGVGQVAWLFVNDTYVGEHIGGYAGFSFEITDFVTPGQENSILVRVSNAYRIDALPLGGDFTKYGGIYRPVSLLVTEKVCITPLDYGSPGVYLTQKKVTAQQAEVDITSRLSNGTSSKARLKVVTQIRDKQNAIIASMEDLHTVPSGSTIAVDQSVTIKNPHLWQGRKDPYLYQVEVSIYDNNRLLDNVIQPLGLRFFRVDPEKGFFLNGQYLDLYGVNRHQDKAGKGNALSHADHRQDMDLILEMGANMVRLSHYQQAEAIYDYADSTGLILWSEIPLVGIGGYRNRGYYEVAALHASGRQQLLEMIRQNYNHPSVFFWGLFNELKDKKETPLNYLKSLQELAKKEDPTRLTTAATNLDRSDLNGVTDVIAWNKYFGWYGDEPSEMGRWADTMHKDFPDRCLGISEYGAGASIYHHEDTLVAPVPAGKWHPEGWQTYYHEENWRMLKDRLFLWSKLIWNMFDFSSATRDEGDHPGMNDKGLITFDRQTKKDAFYFYKANWNDAPMLHLAEKRFVERTKKVTNIKAYGNVGEVQLYINGVFSGAKEPVMGIYLWENITFEAGESTVVIKTKKGDSVYMDQCVWHFNF